MALSPYLALLKQQPKVPMNIQRDIVSALERGASDTVAASAAGLSLKEYREILSWKHGTWEGFARVCRQSRYKAVEKPLKRRVDIASSEDASVHETGEVLKYILPDDFGPQQAPASAGAALGAGGFQLVINKNYEPIAAPQLRDPNVVEGELVED